MVSISQRLASELSVQLNQVNATVALLNEGATVPFIARYRKEVTGGLDDTQLRLLAERLTYLRELDDRRDAILTSIEEQGKMTPELATAIAAAETKARLEDLYLPYKVKRRTKAQIAREAGLEPLAQGLLDDPTKTPDQFASGFVDADKGVADVPAALEGARWILMERFAEDADLVGVIRELLWAQGEVVSSVVAGKEEEGIKFSDYFNSSEALRTMPSHRALALFRGRTEGVLRLSVVLPEPEGATGPNEPERRTLQMHKVVVSEAGASVYSASELAAKELPDLDVTLRGAVSIARRLQDPLAELVRIDPKSIGVGQYQHDVSQYQLARTLDAVVEDCVNAVGADINTASAPLLSRISGLSESIAQHIVAFRETNGAFQDRQQLLDVPRIGQRRIRAVMSGEQPRNTDYRPTTF